ncbi:helix-turn-helix transcriptional regulator [Thermococcus sp.]|uniref:ArsR/SmtB family transcription factor n=1 Tax=Thermococcus sp. TaxID=35749 RepID=UPI0026082DB1|nr:metalloregulator ArsR/SmtB family transcription factor [Thermococcus sp.]
MRLAEVVEKLSAGQKSTVLRCAESCDILDLDTEVDPNVNPNALTFLKAVSNPTRLQMLKLLKDTWLCVCLISQILEKDQTLISHHLRVLKESGLLEERREGKMRFYRTNSEAIKNYLERITTEIV